MYILSQDNKIIINFGKEGCQSLEVHKNIGGGKEAKFAITASGLQMLAVYPEEKNAITELLSIMNALEEGRNTYRIGEIS